MFILCLCFINRRHRVLTYERDKNVLIFRQFHYLKVADTPYFETLPDFEKNKKLLKLLMLSLIILHYRGFLDKIKRNSKFHD